MTTLPYPKDYATNADGQFSQIQIYPAHARLYNPSTRHAKDLSQLMQLRAMMVALDNQEALVKPPKSRIRRNGSMLSEWQLIDPHTNQNDPTNLPQLPQGHRGRWHAASCGNSSSGRSQNSPQVQDG